ncbi:hypothetical protein ACSDQ9_03925 [Aestuariimicrobium soli]|uniref:hypothetical protein n=1 Tax=Aestuariimicrobium soli TaxID=2035834 RepID=UPI003EBA8C0A
MGTAARPTSPTTPTTRTTDWSPMSRTSPRLAWLRGRVPSTGAHTGTSDPAAEVFSLAKHVGAALLVTAVMVVAGPAVGARLNPIPCAVIAITVGVLVWVMRRGDDPAWTPIWVHHQADVVAPRSQADLTTKRLADLMSSAQPGRDFTSHQLSATMAAVAEHRLVRSHGADPDDPEPTARAVLSPALFAQLYPAPGVTPRALNRATLHRHLKEISDL